MTTGYTYTSYKQAVVTQIPSIVDDPNFLIMLPDAIDYGELSIYRDVDFLSLHGFIDLGSTTEGQTVVDVGSGVVVLEELYYGDNSAPVTPLSQPAIRAIFTGASNGPPQFFAIIGAAAGGSWTPGLQVLLGPAPDQAYVMTGYGTQRQATLSGTNQTTFISTQLPDLFWAATMIFWSGYNRNFGAQADDPRQALSWRAEYDRLLVGARSEEVRKKFLAEFGAAKLPAVAAHPQGASA